MNKIKSSPLNICVSAMLRKKSLTAAMLLKFKLCHVSFQLKIWRVAKPFWFFSLFKLDWLYAGYAKGG